jgi:epoxyqueuosine reductase QueG
MDNAAMKKLIRDFILSYPKLHKVNTRWREPIIRFASAKDPLFEQLKTIIRPTHSIPRELLPGANSVVVYFIPFAKTLHKKNFEMRYYASRSWAVAYVETNQLISDINEHLRHELETQGYRVALIPPTHNFDEKSLMSDWSHRHVAYVAGIGRFGFHNLIITEKGCSGRLGSFVTDLALKPSPLPDYELCLHKAGIDCLKCVERCQYEALYVDRFDRHACYRQLLVNDRYHQDLELTDVCGKCSAVVPCSVTNPVKRNKQLEDAKGR